VSAERFGVEFVEPKESDMRRIPIKVLVPIFMFVALHPRPAPAQSYGEGDQVLTLGPLTIRPLDRNVNFQYGNDGYLTGEGEYAAPLILPDGAVITRMCVYGNIPAGAFVTAMIQSVKLVPGGQSPLYSNVVESAVGDNIAIGYGTVCTDPFSYVFRDTTDINGDFIPDNLAHHVLFTIFSTAGLGGVRITWHREVSPPPGVARFADVPTTHPFFPWIEALAASGITNGCGNGTTFCPDAPVTRSQMAKFLAVALGLHFPY